MAQAEREELDCRVIRLSFCRLLFANQNNRIFITFGKIELIAATHEMWMECVESQPRAESFWENACGQRRKGAGNRIQDEAKGGGGGGGWMAVGEYLYAYMSQNETKIYYAYYWMERVMEKCIMTDAQRIFVRFFFFFFGWQNRKSARIRSSRRENELNRADGNCGAAASQITYQRRLCGVLQAISQPWNENDLIHITFEQQTKIVASIKVWWCLFFFFSKNSSMKCHSFVFDVRWNIFHRYNLWNSWEKLLRVEF